MANSSHTANAKDLAGARLAAHTIKGAAANVGAVALQMAALEAERAATSADLAALGTNSESVAREFRRLQEHLGQHATAHAPLEEARQ